VIDAIGAALDAAFPPGAYERHMTGIPVIQPEYRIAILRAQAIFVPSTTAFLILMLFILFRGWKPVAGALLVVTTTLVVTLGLMSLTGGAITNTTTMLPVLVLILAVSDAIHLLHRYGEEVQQTPTEPDAALARATRAVAGACLSTSITTAIGFLSLWLLNIPAIQAFGVYAAAAAGIAYGVTMLTLPAFLAATGYVPAHAHAATGGTQRPPAWIGAAESLHRGKRPLIVVIVVGIALAAGAGSASTIPVESRWFADFRADSPVVQANAFMETHLAGTVVLSLHIVAPTAYDVTTAEGMTFLDHVRDVVKAEDARLTAEAGTTPRVISVLSFGELVAQMERGMHLKAEIAGIPIAEWSGLHQTRSGRIRAFFDEFHRFADLSLRKRLVSDDGREAHIIVRMRDLSSRDASAFVAAVEKAIGTSAPEGYRVVPTGISLMAGRAMDRVVGSILWSIATTLGLIALVILIQLRSPRLALVSIVPNMAPILLTLGVMAILDIPFRFATVMIFSIALGIAVDNTVHLLVRFTSERRGQERSPAEALSFALRGTGSAVLESTVILLFGFGLFLLSRFNATADFGRLGIAVFASALLVSMTLTPALILLLGPPATPTQAPTAEAPEAT
jgi:predicted RND superfamily exporter protein